MGQQLLVVAEKAPHAVLARGRLTDRFSDFGQPLFQHRQFIGQVRLTDLQQPDINPGGPVIIFRTERQLAQGDQMFLDQPRRSLTGSLPHDFTCLQAPLPTVPVPRIYP